MESKKWSVILLAFVLAILFLIGSVTAWVDPFFHYHAPQDRLQYPINNQRYQNNGIVRHFSYDALITGTSMTENFMASECDALFDVNTVKVSFSGATFTELNENLRRALDSNPDIKLVIYGLDGWFLFSGKDTWRTDAEYPTYLYDDNPFNDVSYLLNKEVLLDDTLEVLNYTRTGQKTTDFDTYSNWNTGQNYDAAHVVSTYNRMPRSENVHPFTDEDVDVITYNMNRCIVDVAKAHPDTQFYYFFPPYSCLYWDDLIQRGQLEKQIDAFKLASSLLLEADNIHLFSFYEDYETTGDLNQYRDNAHYCQDVNSLILQRMKNGEYQLTKENYQAHWQRVFEYYQAFDFDGLIAQYSEGE